MAVFRKRLVRALLLSLLLVVVLLVCAPVLTAAGVRGWIWWATRGQKLHCTIEGIDAALFRPVTLRGLHITGNNEIRIDVSAPRVNVGLNLRSIFRMRGHAVHSLVAENVRADIHRNQPKPFFSRKGWADLQRLLPDDFKLNNLDLKIENGSSSVDLHGLTATGNPLSNGEFQLRAAEVSSPSLRQQYKELRGATTWQDNRLTVSALTLARGLDIRSITFDLSDLHGERLGLEGDVDAFRGRLRVNVTSDWSGPTSSWDAAGSANDISLEQTLQALGFTGEVHGLLHACKFTYRGDSHDPKRATASVWMELTRLSWNHRAADVIMMGASLYNQQVQLQQLYVKQGGNQLSASGEAVFPSGNFDWFNPNFGGNISASISDLGTFANLFGAEPGDFAGKIAIEGTINASDRKFGGHLGATGGDLLIFKTKFESLGAKITLTNKAFQFEQLELHRQKDFIRGEGSIEIGGDHVYSGKATIAAQKVSDYAGVIPDSWRGLIKDGRIEGDWTGHGKADSHFGNFRVHATGLKAFEKAALLPFNAELEAEYSPGNMFFRQAHLANEHASLNGFVTLASGYTQIQGLAFDLKGKGVLRGNVFLPFSGAQLLSGSLTTERPDPAQKADVDLNVESVDLRELSAALFSQGAMSGHFASRLSIFGTLGALQGWADFHGRDVSLPNDAAQFSFDDDARFVSGFVQSKGSVQISGCDPILVEGTSPVFSQAAGASADRETFSLSFNFPALFAARLPRVVSHDFFRDGILSGKITWAGPRTHPAISGDLQLTNGKLNPAKTRFTDLSGRIVFQGHEASVEFLNLGQGNLTLPMRGHANFDDPGKVILEITGPAPFLVVGVPAEMTCINEFKLVSLAPDLFARSIPSIELTLTGDTSSSSLRLNSQAPTVSQVASFCFGEMPEGASLTFAVEPTSPPAAKEPASKKKRRRHG